MVAPAFLRQCQLLRDLTHACQLPWNRQQRHLPIYGHSPNGCVPARPHFAIPKPSPSSCRLPRSGSPTTSQTGYPACSSPAWQRQLWENPSTALPRLVPMSLPSGSSHIPRDRLLRSPAAMGPGAGWHRAPTAQCRPPSTGPGWGCCCSRSMGTWGQGVPVAHRTWCWECQGWHEPSMLRRDPAGPPWRQGGHPNPQAAGCRRGTRGTELV